jgi:hypothetical protein
LRFGFATLSGENETRAQFGFGLFQIFRRRTAVNIRTLSLLLLFIPCITSTLTLTLTLTGLLTTPIMLLIMSRRVNQQSVHLQRSFNSRDVSTHIPADIGTHDQVDVRQTELRQTLRQDTKNPTNKKRERKKE